MTSIADTKNNGGTFALYPHRGRTNRVIEMKFLLLLLLAGCATISTEEMYVELGSCISVEGDCENIQARINYREHMIQVRENAKMSCPDEYVAYCDDRMRGCGSKFARKPVEYVCVSRSAMRDMLRF